MSVPSFLPGSVSLVSGVEAPADKTSRLAHRIRDMQTLPYVVVTNSHMSHVYELYYKAFEAFRRISEITSFEKNDEYCKLIGDTLQEHLTVIPNLAMGVLECRDLMKHEDMDRFMNTMLRSVSSNIMFAPIQASPLTSWTPAREYHAE